MICDHEPITCETCPTTDKKACRKARNQEIAENHSGRHINYETAEEYRMTHGGKERFR